MVEIRDPIMARAVLDEVMEWAAVADSVQLLVEICHPTSPTNSGAASTTSATGGVGRLTTWQVG